MNDVTCRGSYALGTACGRCSRCTVERVGMAMSGKLMRPEDQGFSYGELPVPNAFLQWKGTDACFDFRCACGANCHFDGYFAYAVRCPHCRYVYEMPFHLFPRKVDEAAYKGMIADLEPDEDKE